MASISYFANKRCVVVIYTVDVVVSSARLSMKGYGCRVAGVVNVNYYLLTFRRRLGRLIEFSLLSKQG